MIIKIEKNFSWWDEENPAPSRPSSSMNMQRRPSKNVHFDVRQSFTLFKIYKKEFYLPFFPLHSPKTISYFDQISLVFWSDHWSNQRTGRTILIKSLLFSFIAMKWWKSQNHCDESDEIEKEKYVKIVS